MNGPSSELSRADAPEWASDRIEREQQVATFAAITRWLSLMAMLTAISYAVGYLATSDLRILPGLLVWAGFSASVAITRRAVRNFRLSVYFVAASIAMGLIGVAAIVDGMEQLLMNAVLLIPMFFTALLLSPRDVLPIALFSAGSMLVIEWIERTANWSRLDLSAIPVAYWLAHLLVSATIMFLAITLYQKLDRVGRNARESARQLKLLYETSRLFGSTTTLDELLPTVANNLARIVDASGCFVMLADPISGEVVPTAADDAHHEAFRHLRLRPDEPSLSYNLMQFRKPIMVEDIHASPLVNPRLSSLFHVRSLLGLPLVHHDHALGAIFDQ